jgi:hypothetical protein
MEQRAERAARPVFVLMRGHFSRFVFENSRQRSV